MAPPERQNFPINRPSSSGNGERQPREAIREPARFPDLGERRKPVVEARRGRADVALRAQACLKQSAYPDLHLVQCDYHEGVLTLRGRLRSFYLKQMAQTIVAKLEGVEECVNRIEVRSTPPEHS